MKSLFYLAALTIFLVYFYIFTVGKTIVVLNNPIIVFGLVVFGAFLSARMGGRARLTSPRYFFNIGQGLAGGMLMSIGFTVAMLPQLGNMLAMINGVFYWTSFMMPQGFFYLAGMLLGGGAAVLMQRAFYPRFKFTALPENIREGIEKNAGRVLPVLLLLLLVMVGKTTAVDPNGMVIALAGALAAVGGGFLIERNRICMGLMMKEIYFTRTRGTTGKVVSAILILGLIWPLLRISAPPGGSEISGLVLLGSFMMGFGFILADGCYLGSLWKAGQGNLTGFAALTGVFVGAGISSVFQGVTETGILQVAAIKPGLVLVFIVWMAAYFLERPERVVETGSRCIWLLSEAAILSAVLLITYAPHLTLPPEIQVLGLVIFYAAAGLYIWARISLGRYWGEAIVIRDDHRIVTEGPYRLLKHPIYVAVSAALTGTGLLLGSLWGIAGTYLFVVPTLVLRAREEQRLLAGLPGGKEYFSQR